MSCSALENKLKGISTDISNLFKIDHYKQAFVEWDKIFLLFKKRNDKTSYGKRRKNMVQNTIVEINSGWE